MQAEWGEIGDLKVKGYFEMREWWAWNDSEKSSKMENVKKYILPFQSEDTMLMDIMKGSSILQKMHWVCSNWTYVQIPILPYINGVSLRGFKKIFVNLSFTWKIEILK